MIHNTVKNNKNANIYLNNVVIILYFLIGNDGISILENIGGTGIKLPKKLKEVFEQLKKDE